MHRGRRTPPLPQFALLFLFFLLSSITTNAIPPNNTNISSCAQFSCGGQGPDIHYPFWIAQNSTTNTNTSSYCGYPSLQLMCRDQTATLRLPSGDYTVTDINYSSRIISLADPIVLQGPTTCPTAHQNVSIWPNSSLHFTSNDTNLVFYMNCSFVLPIPLLIGCLGRGAGLSFIFWKGSEIPVDHELVSKCQEVVVVPVLQAALEENVGVLSDAFGRVLQRGFELGWEREGGDECRSCERIGGSCGYSETGAGDRAFVCHHMDGSQEEEYRAGGEVRKSGSKSSKKRIIIGSAAVTGGLLLACLLSFLYLYQHEKLPNSIFFWRRKSDNSQHIKACLERYGSLAPKKYRYKDVKRITRKFHEKLGQGGYGTVFKGSLMDGRLVAVKILSDSKGDGEEFINEVASIGRTSHVNIVSLLGFSSEGSKRALIYEYMPNGSLDKYIYSEKSILGLEILYQIAIGVAQGLEYLHRGCNTRIVHFDIKPHNILLDQEFCPKISDFGLAKLCPPKISILSMADPRGTIGFIAPEVFSRNFGVVSSKSDVYSYGMMVLEMVGGRKNLDVGAGKTSEIYFPHWIYKHIERDGNLQAYGVTAETEEIARKMILVGLWCIQTQPESRPSMSKVVDMLQGSLSDLQVPPDPVLSSPQGSLIDSSAETTH